MRTIDDIIADSQKLGEAALREAFEAGRASAHVELKAKVASFFTEIMGPFETQQAAPPVQAEEHQSEGQHSGEGHYS